MLKIIVGLQTHILPRFKTDYHRFQIGVNYYLSIINGHRLWWPPKPFCSICPVLLGVWVWLIPDLICIVFCKWLPRPTKWSRKPRQKRLPFCRIISRVASKGKKFTCRLILPIFKSVDFFRTSKTPVLPIHTLVCLHRLPPVFSWVFSSFVSFISTTCMGTEI